MITSLKTLVMDIEISPMTAYVWNRRDVNIALNQLTQDWAVIAWSAKWLGEPASKIKYYDQSGAKDIYNDWLILQPLWKLLDEADIVITQNGQSFDGPKLNARFIMHRMKPPSPYRHLDTYRIARRVASFTSNKLEYLTDKLCTKYKKLSHAAFPGMSLWVECLKGNKDAWREMKRYNIHDTLATEELYEKIGAWAPISLAQPHFIPDGRPNCGICGKATLTKHKKQVTKTGMFQTYICQHCGAFSKGEKIR